MNRPLLALTAAVAALTACGDGNPPGDVLMYWQFAHTTAQGTQAIYDAQPAGPGQTFCPESGVEFITVRDASGRDIDRVVDSYDCVQSSGDQGIVVRAVSAGTHTWTITGYRGSPGVALYETQFTFTVAPGRTSEMVVTVPGIPDDLEIMARMVTSGAPPMPMTCEQLGATSVSYSIVDWAGTESAFGTFPCVGASPSVLLRGIERDNYAVRLQALSATGAPLGDTLIPVAQGCGSEFDPTFDHFGPTRAAIPVYDIRSFPSVCP